MTDGGGFHTGSFFGRIRQDGCFEPSGRCTDEILETLREFSRDPADYAAAYGRRSGNCCFCYRPLTDERSLAAGYGPVCAENYGLKGQWKHAAANAA